MSKEEKIVGQCKSSVSKELSEETKYEFNVYARQLNKDLSNLMELLRKQDEDNKAILYAGRHIQKIILPVEEYQKMYQRLEAIDNAKPSEFKIVNYIGQCYLQINVNDDEATQIQLPLLEDEIQDVQLAIDKFKQINRAKPSEALEKLDKIDNYLNDVYGYNEIEAERRKDINYIKQALLKAQEQEKALKVIFEKEVDIELLKKETTTFEDYNKWIEFLDGMGINIPKNRNRQLTQEEFELLKRYFNEQDN